jgi:hypothetical protein
MGHRGNLLVDIICPQIDPPNHAGNERVSVSELQQPSRFLKRLAHLHDDTAIDPRRAHLDQGILRHEVTPQPLHGVIDPRILRRVVSPEVNVGIQGHLRNAHR